MNLKNINLKEILRRQKAKKFEPPSLSVRAAKDWSTMLGAFLVVTIVIVVLSLYLFYRVVKGEIFSSYNTKTEAGEVLDENILKQVVRSFESKNELLNELKSVPQSFADPSK